MAKHVKPDVTINFQFKAIEFNLETRKLVMLFLSKQIENVWPNPVQMHR